MKNRRSISGGGVSATILSHSIQIFQRFYNCSAGKILLLIVIQFAAFVNAATISGVITNSSTGLPLADANISIQDQHRGAVSKSDGRFILTNVPAGDIVLITQYIGFETVKTVVHVEQSDSIQVSILLTPTSLNAEELVVTSTRYERAIRDVSIPLAVIRQHDIERMMPRDVSEAVAMEPGLSVTRDGVWGTHINIRGLSRNNVVMLVDGNRIDTANDLAAGLSMIDVNDIDRIEVIKGAGSSLYGTGAIGGVINVLTKSGHYKDDFYMDADVTGGYSSANKSGQGFFTVRGGAAKWFVKVSGMTRSAQDIHTPNGILENSRFSDTNLSARAGFRPFENHEFLVNWQQYRGMDIGLPGGNTLFPSEAEVRYPQENRDLLSFEYNGRNVTRHLTKVSLKYFMQDILRDVENIPHLIKDVPGQPPKRMNVQQILPKATHATNGAQLQTDWLVGRQHFILGLDAWQKELDSFRKRVIRVDVLSTNGDVVKSINQIVGERPIPLSTYQSAGLYLQDEIPLWQNRFIATVGGRYDAIRVENEKTFQPVYIITDGVQDDHPATQQLLWDEHTAQDHSWSGNLGLLYKATQHTDLTLTVARSFRSPFLEERYQYIDLGSLVKVGDPYLKPEQGAFADVGLRYWSNRFNMSTNLFFNQIKNMVVETPGEYEGRTAMLKTNAGSAELYGIDMSLDVRLVRALHAFASAAYVHGADTYVDEPLPLIPPLNGRLGLRGPVFKFVEFECAARLVAEQDRVASWEQATSGYTIFDLYLNSSTFKVGSLDSQLFLGVENIFDRAYRDHLSTNRGSIAIEPGRNVSLRWRFGI